VVRSGYPTVGVLQRIDMSGKADRASKRVRKLSTDSEGEGEIDWTDRRGKAGRAEPATNKTE
jgi:Ino eighty subunit 2